MKISPDLWPREREMLEELLYRRESALAWDFRESGRKINGVTIQDANPPPNPDEFSEEFAGCAIMSLIDFFLGYD
ncbi:hypothetical protein PTT_09396 [Pyrenophora teres f. teres 0-1]|uniref:Uncharacterized protein n=1 Tax=Pyrenophora teres f. teres (strain 0-1) TaxID=861557 RepID=E3RLX4_PYRTT|nr:hypothetical protein PTT_09396 [Pyrenophora teres f. teres 0-1]